MENKIVELEKQIAEMESLMKFKRQCLTIALDNNTYAVQICLYNEINHLKADIDKIRTELNNLLKGKKVVTEEDLKKEINESYKARHLH